KQGGTVSTATELKVNAKKTTSASIGKFGEEDLYFFTAKTDGKYQVETKGASDLVMKLFGPDSETKFIAEDDDSGTGSNARIITSLIPGKYYVQVRHYNPETGTGNYTIRVKKM
ncbi:MAG: peptidase, partial [Chitinophagaceae bacterium]